MADTDVPIDALAGRSAVTTLVRDLLKSRRIVTTAISRIELGVGATNDEERRRVHEVVIVFSCDDRLAAPTNSPAT